jgi:hypothetical protein
VIEKSQLQDWIDRLGDDSRVGVDEGGLTLVEVDVTGKETGAYLEIGSA